ncbi:MATE family efflux transporter [Vibrio olivae]|uniref:MATE family efflux transporter n=1 Tax=Vibrio olivae TaxID=1243002 RepID=A0ABV5HHB7_9VIBR
MASTSIYQPLIKIAIPIIFIQVCQASLGLFDTLIAGRYHFQHLAGVGLGSNLWTPVITLATGVLYALVPKISSSASQRDYFQMKALYQHGKNNAIKLMIFGFITIHLLALSCHWFIEGP